MRDILLAPSLLASDFSCLGEEVKAVTAAGADWVHLDVMDGHFVPNITFGPQVVRALRPLTSHVLDVHLMISPVDSYIATFAEAGADIITVHPEAGVHLDRTVSLIRDLGKKAGVALNPATPESVIEYVMDKIDLVLVMSVNPGFGGQAFLPHMLSKLRRVAMMIAGRPIDLQIDGGITPQTAEQAVACGANVLVAGSSVFSGDYSNNIRALRQAAGRARGEVI